MAKGSGRDDVGDEAPPVVRLSIARRSEHQVIFRKMVRPPQPDEPRVPDGSIVEVRDRDDIFVGYGYLNRKSQAAIRLLTIDPDAVVDDAFFDERLDRALELRHEILDLTETTDTYRLVNAEGDGLPGMVVDRFGDAISVEVYTFGAFRRLGWLIDALKRRFADAGIRDARVFVRGDSKSEALEGFKVRDFEAEKLRDDDCIVEVNENGARFKVDLRAGHKTGFFCDQRENRATVAGLGAERVFDGCCYTGGFALAAALGGSARVEGVDLDEWAIGYAKENARLNADELGECDLTFTHGDVYDVMRARAAASEHYDLVILDPPKFAASGDDDEMQGALHKYRDLNALGMGLLRPGGVLVTCSCSGSISENAFIGALRHAAAISGHDVQVFAIAGPGSDHPYALNYPEGRYLKVVYARVTPSGRAGRDAPTTNAQPAKVRVDGPRHQAPRKPQRKRTHYRGKQ